ncbi:MAG TPA: acetate--CoA ligase [Actinomycetales bacterium]|nr:acetate--CoA ligase [Actinomycetales bacterium]
MTITGSLTASAPTAFTPFANESGASRARAAADPIAWWEQQAARLSWDSGWDSVLDWRPARPLDGENWDGQLSVPSAKWFSGGTLNAAVNCVDRHVAGGRGDQVAYYFEGEPGDRRALTYSGLQDAVSQAANAFTELGIAAGDRVVVYLPVLLETVIATLGLARIGAVHSLVFGGFSQEALRFRIADTRAKAVITSDGQFRRGKAVGVKEIVDAAINGLDHVQTVIVVRRTGDQTYDAHPVPWTSGRDVWWHETIEQASTVHEAQSFDAEHPLFIMYTSGTTGRPKGLVHTTGGYLTHAAYAQWAHFNATPADRDGWGADVHWCTADLAWVTAHTFVLYGPLLNGITSVIYEGTPDTPNRGRHLEIIQRYGVTTYYTAPTLIRSLISWQNSGDLDLADYDLSSVRLLGSVGEPINPAVWEWFQENIGGGHSPVIDTWWQSETGATVLANLPGESLGKPGAAGLPLPGLEVKIIDDRGLEVGVEQTGMVAITNPWPGMARTVWGDPQRYLNSYWAQFARQGYFVAGDGGKRDEHGNITVLGRLDDVVNVSGHRLSSAEVESSLVAHPAVVEAGVTAVPDDLTGQALIAFVIPQRDCGDLSTHERAELIAQLRGHVAATLGPVARPAALVLTSDLPRTRSGKILRRVLGQLYTGSAPGDLSSLHSASAIENVKQAVARHRAATQN